MDEHSSTPRTILSTGSFLISTSIFGPSWIRIQSLRYWNWPICKLTFLHSQNQPLVEFLWTHLQSSMLPSLQIGRQSKATCNFYHTTSTYRATPWLPRPNDSTEPYIDNVMTNLHHHWHIRLRSTKLSPTCQLDLLQLITTLLSYNSARDLGLLMTQTGGIYANCVLLVHTWLLPSLSSSTRKSTLLLLHGSRSSTGLLFSSSTQHFCHQWPLLRRLSTCSMSMLTLHPLDFFSNTEAAGILLCGWLRI